MTGIAITLATPGEAEQVAAIEKLTGLKIARQLGQAKAPAPEPAKAEPRKPKAERRAEPRKAEAKPKTQAETEPKPKPEPEPKPHTERSPVVEDIKADWNGPLPSFLSVRAD